MELSEDAKKLMENRVSRILNGIDLPERNRNEIRRELVSNYIDASLVSASGRGAASVEKADMLAAFRTSEDPEEIASLYMASYVSSLRRAGLLPRSVAYVVDSILAGIISGIVSLPFILLRLLLSPPLEMTEFQVMPMIFQFFYLLMTAGLATVFIYFVICEGYFGYTPGKWLLGLKVLRTDGKKVSYREAMLRTIPKLFTAAIVLDALLIALYHGKDRQRLFDRIAGTIVISRS